MSTLVSDQELDSLNSTSPIAHKENSMIYEPKKAKSTKYRPAANQKIALLSMLLAIGGITCCVVGVVFFERAKKLSEDNKSTNTNTAPMTCNTEKPRQTHPCRLSEEIQTSGKITLNYLSVNIGC